jgi:hemolysin activation/secretion protein
VRGSLELRSPTLAPRLAGSFNDLRLIVFAEAGHAWLRDPLPEQQDEFSLSSVGVGFTAQAFHDLYASAFVADPLESTAGPHRGGVTKKGHPRFQFRLYTQF